MPKDPVGARLQHDQPTGAIRGRRLPTTCWRSGRSCRKWPSSAFLKRESWRELLVIEAGEEIVRGIHRKRVVKIKLEVDTDPPPGFVSTPGIL
jgi:hypothetical protein